MTFEEQFFGPGNLLRWTAIRDGTLPGPTLRRLQPFLGDLRANSEMVILPRAREGGRTTWYVMCDSARALRLARDDIHAFVGPSYASDPEAATSLDASDPIERAVLDRFGSNALRFEVPDAALADAARDRLALLLRLRSERPHGNERRVRATGRILRDFEYALLTRDDAGARQAIVELRASGRLDGANLLFLDIRRRVHSGEYAGVLADPHLPSLLSVRRPRRVTEALISAVYESELLRFERTGEPRAAVEHFRATVLPRYADLFISRAGLDGRTVDVTFLLLAVASNPPRRELADAVVASATNAGRASDYLHSIAALLTEPIAPTPVGDPLQAARTAFAAGDVDTAVRLATALAASDERAVLLLRCAYLGGTLAGATVALGALDALEPAARSRLMESAQLARLVRELRGLVPAGPAPGPPAAPPARPDVPDSWSGWLRALQAPDRWTAAVSVAERGAREWSYDDLVRAPEAVSELADLLLADRPEWGGSALRDALPHLLEFVLSKGAEVRLRALYDNMFLVMVLDEYQSLTQVRAFLRLVQARLELGLDEPAYRELVRELSSALERVNTPAVIDLALDAVDALTGAACPANDARQMLVTGVGALAQRWYRRVDKGQRLLLAALSEELGVPFAFTGEPAGEAAADVSWSSLRNKTVALYSLQESALRRTASILHALCPDLDVVSFHDKVGGSPALRAAATTADVFVIATAVAKHAATGFIEMHRRQKPTLYARGGGSASLLSALKEHLDDQP